MLCQDTDSALFSYFCMLLLLLLIMMILVTIIKYTIYNAYMGKTEIRLLCENVDGICIFFKKTIL